VLYIRFVGTHRDYDKIDAQTVKRGRTMNIDPIKTHRGYLRTLKQIERLMRAKRNTPEGDRLDILVTLVQAWEAKHYPLDLPDARPKSGL